MSCDTVVNMRKVTHQRVQEPLSGTALLPCVFTLRPSPSHEPPRIKWTKLWGQRGADGLQKQQSILVAKDNIIKVKKAFQGRVTLPGYTENRYNASLVLTGLRSSDSGMYRCEVVVGINDEQDTVPLQVTGNVALHRMLIHAAVIIVIRFTVDFFLLNACILCKTCLAINFPFSVVLQASE